MKSYQKTSTDDELKAYLTEGVVDPELMIKEKTGIDGVLGWWKVCVDESDVLKKPQTFLKCVFYFTVTSKGISDVSKDGQRFFIGIRNRSTCRAIVFFRA